MKALRKGSKGEQVKILQGLLKMRGYQITVDGSFGGGTLAIVKTFQTNNNLTADGSVGKLTWEKLGVLPTDNDTLLLKIPFKNITLSSLITHNKERIKFEKYPSVLAYNFIINGGMFDTKTYFVINDTVQGGKVINGGNYSNYGIAFGKKIKPTTTAMASQEGLDFIGGSPSLLPYLCEKGLSKAYLNQSTKWNMIGLDGDNFYYLTNLSAMKMKKMVNWANFYNLTSLINLDGGGSRALALDNSVCLATDGRAIPQVIGLKVRW